MKRWCLLWVAMIALAGCATAPVPPALEVFQAASGASATFVQRGLYSLWSTYGIPAYRNMSDGLVSGSLILLVVETQAERVRYTYEADGLAVSFRPFPEAWDQRSRNVFITAVLGALGLGDSSAEQARNRFYAVVQLYMDSGYAIPGLREDPWFQGRNLQVGAGWMD